MGFRFAPPDITFVNTNKPDLPYYHSAVVW